MGNLIARLLCNLTTHPALFWGYFRGRQSWICARCRRPARLGE